MYAEWKPIYSALVTDIMDQLGYRDQAMTPGIRPIRPDVQIIGPALTLEIFAAYDHASSGDVFVIATNGEQRAGLWGELLSTAAKAQGVDAVVTDGVIRDVRQMNDMGFNCFCTGYSPLDSAGRIITEKINEPIQCGGVQVHPGDFILADYDGVAVIPAAIKDEVYKLSMEKLEGENTVRDELAAGASPRDVFDKYGIL